MAGTASAQAVLEYGLGASRAVTTSAPAAGLGKSVSGSPAAWTRHSKLPASRIRSRNLLLPLQPRPHRPSRCRNSSEAPPAPTPNWEDPSGIEPGLDYEELGSLLRPFRLWRSPTERSWSLTYRGKDGMFQVEVLYGAVKSIAKPQPRG